MYSLFHHTLEPSGHAEKKEELQPCFDILQIPCLWQERNNEELRNEFATYALCSGLLQAKEMGTHQRLKDLLQELRHWSGDMDDRQDIEEAIDEKRLVHWRSATHLKQLIHQTNRLGNLMDCLADYVEGRCAPVGIWPFGDSWSGHDDAAEQNYLITVFCDEMCAACPDLSTAFFDSTFFTDVLHRVKMEDLEDFDTTEEAKELFDQSISQELDTLESSSILRPSQKRRLADFFQIFFHPRQDDTSLLEEAFPLRSRSEETQCFNLSLASAPYSFPKRSKSTGTSMPRIGRWRTQSDSAIEPQFPKILPLRQQRKLASIFSQLDENIWLNPSISCDAALEIFVMACADNTTHALSLAVGHIVIQLNAADDAAEDQIEIHDRAAYCKMRAGKLERFMCDADEERGQQKMVGTLMVSNDSPVSAILRRQGLFGGTEPFFRTSRRVHFDGCSSMELVDGIENKCSPVAPTAVIVVGGAPVTAKQVLGRLTEFAARTDSIVPGGTKETRCAIFTLQLAMYLLQAPGCAIGVGRTLTDSPRSFCDWLCFLSARANMDNEPGVSETLEPTALLGQRFAVGRAVLAKYGMGSGYREVSQEINKQAHVVENADWDRHSKAWKFGKLEELTITNGSVRCQLPYLVPVVTETESVAVSTNKVIEDEDTKYDPPPAPPLALEPVVKEKAPEPAPEPEPVPQAPAELTISVSKSGGKKLGLYRESTV